MTSTQGNFCIQKQHCIKTFKLNHFAMKGTLYKLTNYYYYTINYYFWKVTVG
jgi:hypothetical protein